MNRTILYALFVLLAACAVFGTSQMEGEAGEASVAVPVEQNEVVEGENDAVIEQEPQQPEVQNEQAAPDGVSRGLALKRSRSGSQGGPPAKKRPKWLVPVAIAAGLAVVTGLGIATVFGVKHMKKKKDDKKKGDDKDKDKENKDKETKDAEGKGDGKDAGSSGVDPTKTPKSTAPTSKPSTSVAPPTSTPGGQQQPPTSKPSSSQAPPTGTPGGQQQPPTSKPSSSQAPPTSTPGGQPQTPSNQPPASQAPPTSTAGGQQPTPGSGSSK